MNSEAPAVGQGPTRRNVILGAAGTVAWASAGSSLAGLGLAAAAASPRPFIMIVDDRFPETAAFGEEASRLGLVVRRMRGDVTPIWCHDLDPLWRHRPAMVAGMTADAPLHCLEIMARRLGMRGVYRAEHRPRPDGSMEHAVHASPRILDRARAVLAGADWASATATLFSEFPGTEPGETASVLAETRGVLTSWVIAPVRPTRDAA